MSEMKKRRGVSLLLAAAVLAVMLASVFYLAAEADHDCTGQDCPVCAQIGACENTLKILAMAVGGAALPVLPAYVLYAPKVSVKRALRLYTLVTLRVKLLN